jgi:hypothetical protein
MRIIGGLFPDPITAFGRSRSPRPSRTSMLFLIQADSHVHEPAGISHRRRSSRWSSPVEVVHP